MSRRARSLRRVLLLIVLAGACVVASATGVLAGAVPDALGRLGTPDPSLQPLERAYLTGYLLLNIGRLDMPAGTRLEPVELEVEPGMTAGEALSRLAELGVVEDTALLGRYLRYRGLDKAIEAGSYVLSGSMSHRELAQQLQSASAEAVSLTVPEGWRAEQIAQEVASLEVGIRAEDFMAAAQARPDAYSFSAELPSEGGLEGFLFPDTYFLDQDSSAVGVVEAMLDNFESKLTPDLRRGFEEQGLSLYEAVTLASIVEREAVVADERPRIASVFLNRLVLGMHLDADPTVQYALGRQPDGTWWKRGLTQADLAVDSPYNTYLYPGLPPTPIANPGLPSLEAVARPSDTSFLYFRAACDGSGRHQFAVTFEEQVANACP